MKMRSLTEATVENNLLSKTAVMLTDFWAGVVSDRQRGVGLGSLRLRAEKTMTWTFIFDVGVKLHGLVQCEWV